MTVATSDFEAQVPHFSGKHYFGTIVSSALFLGFFVAMGIYADSEKLTLEQIGAMIVAGSIFSVVFGSVVYITVLLTRKAMFNLTRGMEKVESIRKTSEQIQGELEQDFVTNLVRINFKYIDAYYLQTKLQADKSFNFALSSAVVSLLLIIVGIFLSLLGKTNSATVSAGAGILGEFISAVFFYLYNQTIAKMADYHRKLVFTQNIGLALKISDGLPPDEKSQAQRALIEALSRNINQYLAA